LKNTDLDDEEKVDDDDGKNKKNKIISLALN
jgi:hypothetical protein